MNKAANNKKIHIVILSYCLALYFIWSMVEILFVPKIEQYDFLSIDVFKEIMLKIIIWFIPASILITHFDESVYIKKKELFQFERKYLIKCIPIFLLFTIYLFVGAYVQNGQISVSESFHAVYILIALSVGISEEMVFRGWLLNAALKERKQWIPVLINAVLFLIIHFPIWIRSGLLLTSFTSGAFLQIIILSVIFSWTFIKSKSILIPAALHVYWDLLCFMFGFVWGADLRFHKLLSGKGLRWNLHAFESIYQNCESIFFVPHCQSENPVDECRRDFCFVLFILKFSVFIIH